MQAVAQEELDKAYHTIMTELRHIVKEIGAALEQRMDDSTTMLSGHKGHLARAQDQTWDFQSQAEDLENKIPPQQYPNPRLTRIYGGLTRINNGLAAGIGPSIPPDRHEIKRIRPWVPGRRQGPWHIIAEMHFYWTKELIMQAACITQTSPSQASHTMYTRTWPNQPP